MPHQFIRSSYSCRKIGRYQKFLGKLATIGPKYGHFPKSTKPYLIVKKITFKMQRPYFWHEHKEKKKLGVVDESVQSIESSVFWRPCQLFQHTA